MAFKEIYSQVLICLRKHSEAECNCYAVRMRRGGVQYCISESCKSTDSYLVFRPKSLFVLFFRLFANVPSLDDSWYKWVNNFFLQLKRFHNENT